MTLTTTHFGVEIPRIGLGTWNMQGRACERTVADAIAAGYRHIDTAQAFCNEGDIGRALKSSRVDRDELFVATKVWIDDYRPYDLLWSVRESLDRLRLDHVDMLLLHWPNSKYSLERTLDAMSEAVERGLTRHIGVANFTSELFAKASRYSDAPLVCNEVEMHPFIDQSCVMNSVRASGAAITAYAPLANGGVFENGLIRAIASDHGRTSAQIVLRWLMQQDGVIALPRPSSAARAEDNLNVFDFELSDEEMARINSLRATSRRLFNPVYAPRWDEAA